MAYDQQDSHGEYSHEHYSPQGEVEYDADGNEIYYSDADEEGEHE